MAQLYKRTYDKSNFIHPTAILGDGVEMGNNNYIGPYCVFENTVVIGSGNRFESHVVIGSNAEKHGYFKGNGRGVNIGHNSIFREFVTVNCGTTEDTIVGNNVIMLRNSYLGHDSIIENNSVLSCNVLIGGHSYLMEGCNMALGSICHQYSVIGAYSMCGMGCIINKSSRIEPGNIYVGNPCRFLKINKIGLERNEINFERLFYEEERYFNISKKEI